jgi:hypothetical protein
VLDESGRSDFGAVNTAISLRGRGLVFVAFDLMFLDGKDLRALAVQERRAELRRLIPRSRKSRVQFSEAIAGSGPDIFASAERLGLEIVDDRHQRGATIITSQVPVEHWHDVIADPTIADAVLDRIIHNAYRLELKGDSMRKITAQRVKLDAAKKG